METFNQASKLQGCKVADTRKNNDTRIHMYAYIYDRVLHSFLLSALVTGAFWLKTIVEDTWPV